MHVHAKDTRIDGHQRRLHGVLETTPPDGVADRAWPFTTVGAGQGEQVWRDIPSMLAGAGYDGTVSVEHEDRLMSVEDGLAQAVSLLRRLRPTRS